VKASHQSPVGDRPILADCDCGKTTYATRKAANAAARRANSSGNAKPLTGTGGVSLKFSAYKCPQNPRTWHAGHSSGKARELRREGKIK
jgi:hypothetical protein